jgi:viologen exporter family transport system permease protein
VAEATITQAYAALVRSRVAAQASYRASFLIELGAQIALVLVEFVEVYVVFHQVDSLAGFDFAEVALMYGLASVGFGVADLVVGHVDRLPFYLRTGTFDAFLLRPLSSLGQLVTSDFSLRRLGRVLTGIAVLAVALSYVDVHWTPARLLLLVVTPLAGAVIFSAVFVATSTIGFWVTEGMEFANAFTYGGNYLSTFPFTVFGPAIRRFFTFVIPAAFVAYLPALALLGRRDPNGLPAWLSWSALPVSVLAAVAALLIWRTGLRRYVGAGS